MVTKTNRFISTADRIRYARNKRAREEAPIVMAEECTEQERYEPWLEAFNAKIDPKLDVDQLNFDVQCKFREQRIEVDVTDCDWFPKDFYGTHRWKVMQTEGEIQWNAIISLDESYEVSAPVRRYMAVYYVVKV